MRKAKIIVPTLVCLIPLSLVVWVGINSKPKFPVPTIILGIVLLVVYMWFLVPYLKEVRKRRKREEEQRVIAAKKEEEQRLKAAEDEKLQRITAETNEKIRRLMAMREEELRPFLKSNQRLWQCVNCEYAMTDEQRMKYGVCPTCKGDTWVKTHTDQQILYFVVDEFSLNKPLPSDIDIKDVETRLLKSIKAEKEARKSGLLQQQKDSLRSQEDLLQQQSYLLREQNEETRKLRMVEEEKLAVEEEQLRELREQNRHD